MIFLYLNAGKRWRVSEGGRRPPKSFLRLGGRFMAAPTQEPRKKIKNLKKRKLMNFSLS